jgi:hypothetical protein
VDEKKAAVEGCPWLPGCAPASNDKPAQMTLNS